MTEAPWLTIVGIGEDGVAGLSAAARAALADAEIVTGATRHLALAGELRGAVEAWPVPFEDGIARLIGHRGRRVVMLASGDPFWFGAGTSVTRHLGPGEWIAHPAPSSFALAAARLGWGLEDCTCLGLHAAPFGRLRPHIARGRRAIVLVRDGAAVGGLAAYLDAAGFGASSLHVLESLGGPRERIRVATAATIAFSDIAHPVAVGIVFEGAGAVMPQAGLSDAWFAHDGQITKSPIRAVTLDALAPKPGESLWDIGAGSGSIGISWLLAHPSTRAIAFEADPVRAGRIADNAAMLGVDRLAVVEGPAPECLDTQACPDAVFVGGGLSEALLRALWPRVEQGARIVANAVTLESEALLTQWQAAQGGSLMRIEVAQAVPIGTRRGWRTQFPVVQWAYPA